MQLNTVAHFVQEVLPPHLGRTTRWFAQSLAENAPRTRMLLSAWDLRASTAALGRRVPGDIAWDSLASSFDSRLVLNRLPSRLKGLKAKQNTLM